ncbi:MAG: hypothetical protein WCB67_02535 [Solirubrobacteraceae bacterium]
MTDARDLYGLPRELFVPERGALAKSLRAEGDREQAASVAGLRKPSVAAWAVNQLIRTQDRAVASLFQAGDALLHTQAELLAGRGDARALREAAERERVAVDELVNVSRGLLSTNGYELTQTTLDNVTATLHAAALSEEAREKVRQGCLERELRYVGFGTSEAPAAPALGTPAKPRSAKTGSGEKREVKGPGQAQRAQARRAKRERAEKLKQARKAEVDARQFAERADAELEAAHERRDQVATELGTAEDVLDKARERAKEAARAHRLARQALAEADDR